MERVTLTTKSFIIALALVQGHITAEQAALASHVEVASQIERWGEVEDCTYVTVSVHPTRLNSDTQPTTWITMTCGGTLGAQLV
jgi:chaperone required for assembly of F1-ATPase